ncbi:MAG: hypothetical protein JWN84_4433 [Nocardioides sp.]|nr:hypothetical protein [Nocardioides sp.]
MEPIPESRELVEEFGPFVAGDLLGQLQGQSARVRLLVPACVGVSVALLDEDIALTLVATDEEIAALDAAQYLAGGPCVEAALTDQTIAVAHDAMVEQQWALFAAATAAAGIRSTLSLPVLVQGRVTGSVNLYASAPTAFDGQHAALADVFGAWAEGAVSNADLSFDTRTTARESLSAQRSLVDVIRATALLAERLGLDFEHAEVCLAESADRAGLPLPAVARMVITALTG